MNTPAKPSVFALGLATVLGVACGAGHLAGPIRASAEATNTHTDMGEFAFRILGADGRREPVTARDSRTSHKRRLTSKSQVRRRFAC
ncbi:hypothetical protein GCM10023191_001300 [Actinoallomurus oryzae]|uniref:Lipoprotein n=1 Tax=Actinoallomurus oryzae TaxID=502180 RepID=A0ABP8P7A0_9ACTN